MINRRYLFELLLPPFKARKEHGCGERQAAVGCSGGGMKKSDVMAKITGINQGGAT